MNPPMESFRTARVKTESGTWWVVFTPSGIRKLLRARPEGIPEDKLPTRWADSLVLAAAGKRPLFPVSLQPGGTAFQKSVWNALLQIPYGKTKNYGEIARSISNPNAARAVGAACGANPIPFLIPCHRVVASSGSFGGFSLGLPLKRKLLASEAANSQGTDG